MCCYKTVQDLSAQEDLSPEDLLATLLDYLTKNVAVNGEQVCAVIARMRHLTDYHRETVRHIAKRGISSQLFVGRPCLAREWERVLQQC